MRRLLTKKNQGTAKHDSNMVINTFPESASVKYSLEGPVMVLIHENMITIWASEGRGGY
jgi:hypothetical protein